ncbi:ATP cone domain-containing protein [uncultured Anaerococcus sp.]|uniref:ATP cone domain-containing protein n=1 Tax=uncultured Anaerococcus sp. TaxID=293428 RepID=UPI00280B3032|nr:ATP cone domain-containing protein [uncultured Anaerococcus sp.]
MTEKILNLLTDFLKNNKIEGLDLGEIAKSLPVDEIMEMVTGCDEYVVKRSGNIEKYNEDKISRSIKNAADRAGMQINTSDVSIILKDVADRLFHGDDKRITRTTEVRDIILEALENDGFSKISEAYKAYSKSQN